MLRFIHLQITRVDKFLNGVKYLVLCRVRVKRGEAIQCKRYPVFAVFEISFIVHSLMSGNPKSKISQDHSG